MHFNDSKSVSSSKRDLRLDTPSNDKNDRRKKTKIDGSLSIAQEVLRSDGQEVLRSDGYDSSSVAPGSKRDRAGAQDVLAEASPKKEMKLRIKVPSQAAAFRQTSARIVKAKLAKSLAVLEAFEPIGSAFLDGPRNKKDVRGFHRSLAALKKKIEGIDKQFPDGKLPLDDRFPDENRYALIGESKRGEALYSERGPHCDLVMNVLDSEGELVASEFAHKKQLEAFSREFDFRVNPDNPKQFVLNMAFAGTEREFKDLLWFIYTGKLQTDGFSPAALQFAKAYGVAKISDFDQAEFEKRTLLDRLLELSTFETIEEVASAIRAIIELGYGENQFTRNALTDRFSSLCRSKFRPSLKEDAKAAYTEVVKGVEKLIDDCEHVYDFFDLEEDEEEGEEPVKRNNMLFDFSRHSKCVSPSLQCALMEAADQSKDPSIRKLGMEESSNYCIEPPPAVIRLQGHLCAVTVGIVSNEQNTDACFYFRADPLNKIPLLVKVQPQGLRLLKSHSLNPGQILFFPCQAEDLQNTLKAARLVIAAANPEAAKQKNEEDEGRQCVVFHSWNMRRAEWIIERNRLTFASKVEQTVLNTIQELALAAEAIKSASGIREIRDISQSVIKLLEADLGFMPWTIGNIGRLLRAHDFPLHKRSEVNFSNQYQPSASMSLQEALPRNSLSVQSVKDERLCRFVFEGDGITHSFPLKTIEGRMIFADAGTREKKENEDLVFPLAGNSSDINHQFLIEYAQTNCVSIKPLSVNELGGVILFGDQYEMSDFVEKVKLHYLSRPGLLRKGEILNLPVFRLFRHNQLYDLLVQIVQLEGCATSSRFADRVQLLLPDPAVELESEKDQELLQACIKTLCHEKNIDIIIETMAWAKSHGYTSVHRQICKTLLSNHTITNVKEFLRFVLEGGFNFHITYQLNYSGDIDEFYREFKELYTAFLPSSGAARKIIDRVIESCLEVHCDLFIVPTDPADEDDDLLSSSSDEMSDFEALRQMLLPTHAANCVRYKLKKARVLTTEESIEINAFLNAWIASREYQQSAELKTCLSALPYTEMTKLKNFITFAEKAYDKTHEEQLITNLKFRQIVIQFNKKK